MSTNFFNNLRYCHCIADKFNLMRCLLEFPKNILFLVQNTLFHLIFIGFRLPNEDEIVLKIENTCRALGKCITAEIIFFLVHARLDVTLFFFFFAP